MNKYYKFYLISINLPKVNVKNKNDNKINNKQDQVNK